MDNKMMMRYSGPNYVKDNARYSNAQTNNNSYSNIDPPGNYMNTKPLHYGSHSSMHNAVNNANYRLAWDLKNVGLHGSLPRPYGE